MRLVGHVLVAAVGGALLGFAVRGVGYAPDVALLAGAAAAGGFTGALTSPDAKSPLWQRITSIVLAVAFVFAFVPAHSWRLLLAAAAAAGALTVALNAAWLAARRKS